MRRFSYVADYCPTDLSVKLTTLSQSGRYTAISTDKRCVKTGVTEYRHVDTTRKPLSCINSGLNCISEITSGDSPQILNDKLSFNEDCPLPQNEDTSFTDDEITFEKVCCCLHVQCDVCWFLFLAKEKELHRIQLDV